MTWVAYLDESMRQRRDGSGLYVLAAAIVAEDDVNDIRLAMTALAGPHQRFHWRDVLRAERGKAVATVAGLNALHLVVVGVGLDNARQERGRRHCLSRLLWELSGAGVRQAWLESRTPSLNAKDIALVDVLRVRGELADDLRIDFAYPRVEPLLWLPDIVAGAVSTARGDGDEQHLTLLAPLLTEYMIDLD